ncbi:MAG: hypothetical protein JNJ69_10585 [Leptospiraceae bacterium]|nr:hypothetical protein [Leptospiraceae bacterium]
MINSCKFAAFTISCALLIGACSSKTKAEENIAKPEVVQPMGQIETVTGVVAVNDNNGNPQVLIEVKKDTRSKISYEVTGNQKDAVAARKGKKITATGIVRNLSPFHKLIDVSTIE